MADLSNHPIPLSFGQLAERCAASECSSRELDGLIFITKTPGIADAGRIDQMGGVVGWWPRKGAYQSAREVPCYTSSMDDAFMLIPDGWALTLDRYIISDDPAPNERTWRVWLKRLVGDIEGDGPCGIQKVFATGATPALAITGAALKALSPSTAERKTP